MYVQYYYLKLRTDIDTTVRMYLRYVRYIHDQQASYAILYSLVILVEEKSLKSGQVIKRPSQNNMRGYSTHIYVSIMEKREDDT